MDIRIHMFRKIKYFTLYTPLLLADKKAVEEEIEMIQQGLGFKMKDDINPKGEFIEAHESNHPYLKGNKVFLRKLDRAATIEQIIYYDDSIVCLVDEYEIIENERTEKSKVKVIKLLEARLESINKREDEEKELIGNTSRGFFKRLFN